MTVSARSVAVTPLRRRPVSRTPTTVGKRMAVGSPTMAACACRPPTPQPSTPIELTIGVWLSVAVSDVVLVYVIGLLSFLLRRTGVPLAPVLIGVILGPLAERELRRAMALGQGDPAVLLDSAIAVTLYAVLAPAVIAVLVVRRRSRRTAVPA